MGEEAVWNVIDLTEGGDGALEIPGVPENDRRDDKVQARSAMLLVLVGSVTDFTKPVNEDRSGKAVA